MGCNTDWKNALRQQIDMLAREAWNECQSNSGLLKAWVTADAAEDEARLRLESQVLNSQAEKALLRYFDTVEGDDGFGNGRGVRNVLEAAIVRHANRVAAIQRSSDGDLTDNDLTILIEADVVGSNFTSHETEQAGARRDANVISERPANALSSFSTNDRVFHQKFGYGKVVSIDGSKLTVAFETAGEKRVIDSFVEIDG